MRNGTHGAEYFSIGMIGLSIGMMIGAYGTRYIEKPDVVYITELNGDDRADLIIKANNGRKTGCLQQEDGSYKALDEILSEQQEFIKQKINE